MPPPRGRPRVAPGAWRGSKAPGGRADRQAGAGIKCAVRSKGEYAAIPRNQPAPAAFSCARGAWSFPPTLPLAWAGGCSDRQHPVAAEGRRRDRGAWRGPGGFLKDGIARVLGRYGDPGSDGHHGALVVRGFCNLGGRLPRHSGMVARAAAVAVSGNATLKARQRPAPPD